MVDMIICDECGESFDIDSEGIWVENQHLCESCEEELTYVCTICEDCYLEADRGDIGSIMVILDPGEVTGVSDGIYEIVDNPYYRVSIIGNGFSFLDDTIRRLGEVPEDIKSELPGNYPIEHLCEICGETLKRRAILKRNYRG